MRETIAREAVALADRTNDPTSKADARIALAEVLELAAKTDEAAEAPGRPPNTSRPKDT
jgi:hypothetical protein